MSSKLRTILGTMEFSRRLNLQQSEEMAKVFMNSQKDGLSVELDTAFMYAGGKSEELMGKMSCRLDSKMQIATKANSRDGNLLDAKGLRYQLETSLKRMQVDSVHLFYLHHPDHNTPIIETLRGVNKLYQDKKFKEFGLSNFSAWEVAEVYTICKNNSWVLPTVYQGMYNCLTRSVEKELFKCLNHFNIRFYAYNPLCGGILSGKHEIADDCINKKEPGRFYGKGWADAYRKRYWKEEIFNSVSKIQEVLLEVYGNDVSIAEASYRWLYHHSLLDGERGDGVIIGASSMDQFNANIGYTTKGKLDDRVVEIMDKCWADCCFSCPDYMR